MRTKTAVRTTLIAIVFLLSFAIVTTAFIVVSALVSFLVFVYLSVFGGFANG